LFDKNSKGSEVNKETYVLKLSNNVRSEFKAYFNSIKLTTCKMRFVPHLYPMKLRWN